MRILITGAQGEVGHGLIKYYSKNKNIEIEALDLREPDADFLRGLGDSAKNITWTSGNITDSALLDKIFSGSRIDYVFHLAAVLSTSGEKDPLRAHQVNVEGSLNLLRCSHEQGKRDGKAVTYVLPSTIAVYGRAGVPGAQNGLGIIHKTHEFENLSPLTMYGLNKLYVENLGRYFSTSFGILSPEAQNSIKLDFRCLRFPGLISADTVPTGGTSDYAAEMIHAAAQGKAYECFVRPESKLPFMAMPDAVLALVKLAEAPKENLTQHVYKAGAFACSAEQIKQEVYANFPGAEISYREHPIRLKIVESWPQDVDDSAARKDWGWNPEYNFTRAFREYLVPQISSRYGKNNQAAQVNAA